MNANGLALRTHFQGGKNMSTDYLGNISTTTASTIVSQNNSATAKSKTDSTSSNTNVSSASNASNSTELSEKAQKYYEQLKKKFSNMEFVLVSAADKEKVAANAGSYANNKGMVVLIDTDKIEKMAEDEDYRKKYEGIIANAATQMAGLSSSLGTSSGSVKAYGMKFDDGGNASFFAVIDKSYAAQRERIAKKAEQKSEDAKEAKKEAVKEVTASSIEELLQKINDTLYDSMSDNVKTDTEKLYGQNFDFTV